MKIDCRYLSAGRTALAALATASVIILPASAQEEGVFLDPQTDDYLVRFLDEGELQETTFYPRTKVDPSVKSKFTLVSEGVIAYRYKIRNARTSKQDLRGIDIYPRHAYETGLVTPPGPWRSVISRDSTVDRYSVGWVYLATAAKNAGLATRGLPPGSQAQFGLRAAALPGIEMMRFQGSAKITMMPGEGPDPESAVGKQLDALERNDFVLRAAATPIISVPSPFDAVAVLGGLQAHIQNELLDMNLVDPVFALQLDRGLQAAIDAAKHGNQVALRAELKALRHELKRAHPELTENEDADEDWGDEDKNTKRPIAKLAAKVLDFDIKYVLKRVGEKD